VSEIVPKNKNVPVTRALAEFAAGLRFEDLPDSVIAFFKIWLLDTLGCGVVGCKAPWSQQTLAVAKEMGGLGKATVIADGAKLHYSQAAFANSMLIESLNFSDVHTASHMHVASIVLPGLLAMSEVGNRSGREVITAAVAGAEVTIRTALGIPVEDDRGFHTSGTFGSFGAAAAMGRIQCLTDAEMINALGLAGTQSCGIWAPHYDGANAMRLHPALSVRSGIFAADLAAKGFTASTRVLECEDGGVYYAFSDGPRYWDRILKGLGTDFTETFLAIGLKVYPCVRSAHAMVSLLLDIMEENDLVGEEIVSIRVFAKPGPIQGRYGPDVAGQPDTSWLAQFSVPYAIAVTALDKACTVDQFFPDERVRESKVQAYIRECVSLESDPEISKYPKYCARVEVTTRDGREFSKLETRGVKGDVPYPLTFEDVEKKFLSLTAGALSSEKSSKAIDIVRHFEDLENVGELMDSLTA
jgi:2-methylcitrate dehydratase PrpD